ncbi:PAAR domain-containing protein [Paraburkholderia saeva]|uniref:PAAR domain-containing protein n=1 Tax=Paraburkholderia saeva TaxID=2777537 RepID=UPI00226C3663|nr:PAAR domain-containing protein [Paraburkholderia saeva]
MQRSYLRVGDKSSVGGTAIEGIPFVSHEGKALTFVGAHVSCPACKSTGQIVAKGPRLPVVMMGKMRAMEGDICQCNCSPAPVMIASQSSMFETIQGHELASMGYGPTGNLLADEPTGDHWIRFALNDAGSCEGLRCRAHFSDGSMQEGVFDSDNKVHFERPNASACQKLEVVHSEPQTDGVSVVGSLLSAMVGQT